MEKALKSAASLTFGFSNNSRSSGKGKNSKSNKGDSKATREFLEKEIINSQEKNEIKEMSQLTGFCESDGQSYGTSEEENEIELSQQQLGQEKAIVGEPRFVSQETGQACLAVQEEDALSGDEICQQQSKQLEETSVQQSTDVVVSSIEEADSQVVQSTKPVEVSQKSNVSLFEDAAGVISAESQMVGQALVEESKVLEETKVTKTTSIVSQETQKVSQTIERVIDESDAKIVKEVEAVVKSTDVSEQSQQTSQSIVEPVVSACYAAEPTPEFEILNKSIVSTTTQTSVDIVDAAVPEVEQVGWCGVTDVPKINAEKEINQSFVTKTTEVYQDSTNKTTVVEKCNGLIETESSRTLKVEMFLEARSKFSATIEEDSEVLITAKFVNPLATPLTEGKFWIEADNLGKPYLFEIPHIDAGETVICRALIFPRCAGYEFIVARFVSREIKRIVGFTNIRVSRAISYESTSDKIVVPKIINQKISTAKKM